MARWSARRPESMEAYISMMAAPPKSLKIPVGIPNGFIQLGDTNILIVDSYMKSVDLYTVDCSNSTIQFRAPLA